MPQHGDAFGVHKTAPLLLVSKASDALTEVFKLLVGRL